ncbi:MAG: [Bacteroidaceae bacterium]|nr:[FeFe] hydrogenase H-cluster radical SAM maturase HydE [Bacteroidaceae bacterium]
MNKKEFFALLECLVSGEKMEKHHWQSLLSLYVSDDESKELASMARSVCDKQFGRGVYVRGLVEISSYCKNNCYYCGLRCANKEASRYRLTKEQILTCCRQGAELGFNTFVLQGGEDPLQTNQFITDVVAAIHHEFPEKAITLSVGERSRDAYAAFRHAGAERYLLRHETASPSHYARLHPSAMSDAHRKQCLFTLKELGYQVGSGMMIGSPQQTLRHIAEDFVFLDELQPQMIGIGPFIPATGTPFATSSAGSARLTLFVLSLLRLRFPKALIPATTALATLLPDGMERGILAGANVVMPNLSPIDVRDKYSIYNNKKSSGSESAQSLQQLATRLGEIGYHIDYGRGDYPA